MESIIRTDNHSYLFVHKELYGILITDVCLVQLKGEVDVVPHVVVMGHVVVKALGRNRVYCIMYTCIEIF